MSDIVIRAENIGKLYKLGEIGTGTISHDLNRWWARVRGKEDPFAKVGSVNDRTVKGENDWVWALKDVNFEVKQGEVLGIIGRNGAGKSTLLKILSKVTSPSSGCIKVKGRIASLLEVGTGFHQELTGRENIFLNGAILGMTKAEIKSKFDEIVDFAGVERYIDTPVKRYSSGMYVRLAFAVAAFLEPEILIVDEVLAVGDAEFQKKCLGRMKDVSVNEGRTVLFVSHNMSAIQSLCNKGLYLSSGTVAAEGAVIPIMKMYLENLRSRDQGYERRLSNTPCHIKQIQIKNSIGEVTNNFTHEELISIVFMIHKEADLTGDIRLIVIVQDDIQRKIFANEINIEAGMYTLQLPGKVLVKGSYSLNCIIYTPASTQYDVIEECCNFNIVDTSPVFSHLDGFDYGIVMNQGHWEKNS
jgi:lipopolysaccharide transport system ATP-binding protein